MVNIGIRARKGQAHRHKKDDENIGFAQNCTAQSPMLQLQHQIENRVVSGMIQRDVDEELLADAAHMISVGTIAGAPPSANVTAPASTPKVGPTPTMGGLAGPAESAQAPNLPVKPKIPATPAVKPETPMGGLTGPAVIAQAPNTPSKPETLSKLGPMTE